MTRERPSKGSLLESALGDLVEEWRRRAANSRARAAAWLCSQAVALATYLLVGHAGGAIRDTATSLRRGVSSGERELRHAVRTLRRAPWYSLAVIGVLAAGMALAATVFAVVDGVLFKPLPYPRSWELMSIQAGHRTGDGSAGLRPWVSATDVTAWREAMPDVAFTIFRTSGSARFEETNDAPLGVAEVEARFFDVIGVRPLLGGFSQEHFEGTSTVGATMISYPLWQSRFAGAPNIVGRTIRHGTATMEIVGVLPPGFVFPARQPAEVLMPLRPTAAERDNPRWRGFEVIARVPSPGTSETTRERVEAAMAHVAESFPPPPPLPPGRRYANPGLLGPFDRAGVVALEEWIASRPRAMFFAVFASAAALVLLACVNVSGLMAARSLDRQRELELRRALGARVEHIAALVLAEATLLAGAGSVLGVVLSVPCLRIAIGLLPADLALLKAPAIDWRVLGFAVIATTLCISGVSVWPIRRGVRATGLAAVAAGSRSAPRVRSSGRFVVVSSQIAIGLALTLGGTLLVGSLVRLWQDDIGIDPADVFAVEVRIPASASASKPDGTEGILVRLLHGIRSIPGVAVAGATDAPLLRNTMWADDGWRPPSGARSAGYLNVHGITSGFFDAVRPRLLAGRLPTGEELDGGAPVVVISNSVAQAFWPGRPAISESLDYTLGRGTRFTVIGVVADARFTGWDDDRFRQIYAPLVALRRGSASPSILMRTDASARVLAAMQPLMSAEGADVRAIRAMPLTSMLAETVRRRRFQSWLFGSFALAALAIVGVGVVGLMAMTAARRTREIGLRMALGATGNTVVRLFLREQLAAVTVGVLAGLIISAWAVRFVQAYLYGLTPYDPRAWLLAALLIGATATAGTLIPALHACRIGPSAALRLD